MTARTPGSGTGRVPARLAPVRVPYDSARSVQIAERLTRDVSGTWGRVVRVGGWLLIWDLTVNQQDPDERAYQLAVGYRPYVSACELVNPCWLYLRPACTTSMNLAQVARRVLDGGLSRARLLAACQDPPAEPAGGWTMRTWQQAGYPLIAKYPDGNLECVQGAAVIDALSDEQRQVAISLGDGWSGTLTELLDTVRAILADPT